MHFQFKPQVLELYHCSWDIPLSRLGNYKLSICKRLWILKDMLTYYLLIFDTVHNSPERIKRFQIALQKLLPSMSSAKVTRRKRKRS